MAIDLSFSRREFLKATGAFGAYNFAMWMGGCESCNEKNHSQADAAQYRQSRP